MLMVHKMEQRRRRRFRFFVAPTQFFCLVFVPCSFPPPHPITCSLQWRTHIIAEAPHSFDLQTLNRPVVFRDIAPEPSRTARSLTTLLEKARSFVSPSRYCMAYEDMPFD